MVTMEYESLWLFYDPVKGVLLDYVVEILSKHSKNPKKDFHLLSVHNFPSFSISKTSKTCAVFH